MIAEVDTTGKGVINFRDFLEMMLGKDFDLLLKNKLTNQQTNIQQTVTFKCLTEYQNHRF
jgi:hypothetical protein